MAAEEWGIIDSKYDWSTGAYNQVFRVHPDWQGKVIADLNFELPAHAHNRQDAIRCTYEYADFIRQFTDSLTVPKEAYPDGSRFSLPSRHGLMISPWQSQVSHPQSMISAPGLHAELLSFPI